MRKLLCAMLALALLLQAPPFQALAAVGRVLTREELAAAYAMTGYGDSAVSNAYHSGMRPNALWSASQLSDYLEDILANKLHNVSDILSRASYTLAENAEALEQLTGSRTMARAQEMYLEAEALRETLRDLETRVEENGNLIAEMTRRMEEAGGDMFPSDRVRASARIEMAAEALKALREQIVENAPAWEAQIDEWGRQLRFGPAYGDPDGSLFIGDTITGLFSAADQPTTMTDSARVFAVSATNTRLSRLSALANASDGVDASVTVVSKNQVCLDLVAAEGGRKKGVAGVEVGVQDALSRSDSLFYYETDRDGRLVLPTNQFCADEYDIIHLRLEVDPRAQGYRNFTIEDLDLSLGDVYTAVLEPLGGDAAPNATQAEAAVEPYLVSASFNGKDILKSGYEMIYSEANDYEFDLRVEIANPSGAVIDGPYLIYYAQDDYYAVSMKRHAVAPTSRQGNVYIFRGPWKQLFSPNASEKQRPVISVSDAEDAKPLPTQLISVRGATGKPINEGSGAGAGVFSNVLGNGLGISAKIPVVDITVNLELPFSSYLPRLSIDPAGYVTIYVGSPAFEDSVKKSKLNWQSHDMKRYSQMQSKVEQKGMLAGTKARYNLARDYYKTKSWKMMGESKLNVGWFVLASGRWELDNDIPDVLSKNVQLRVGSGFTVTYSYSWTISYPVGPVPMYVCYALEVAAGFALDMKLSFCWVNGAFRDWQLRALNSLTINLRFAFSAQFGVGIKGFLEAWMKFSASLNAVLRLGLPMTEEPLHLVVSYDLSMTLGLTVFFAKVTRVFPAAKGTLYDSLADSENLLNAYMRNDAPTSVEAAHDDPLSYPRLAAEAEEVEKATSSFRIYSGFKRAAVDGQDYMFYICDATDKDGNPHKRVQWINAGNALKYGSLQDVLDSGDVDMKPRFEYLKTRDDYAFDVRAGDGFIYLVALCAERFDGNGFPQPNNPNDYEFMRNVFYYIAVLEPDGRGGLTHRLSVTDRHGHSVCLGIDSLRSESATDPQIAYAAPVWADAARRSLDHFEVCGGMPPIAYGDSVANGFSCFRYEGTNITTLSDGSVLNQRGEGYNRVQAFITELGQHGNLNVLATSRQQCLSFIALSRPAGGAGDSVIELYDMDMGYWPNESRRANRSLVIDEGPIEWIQPLFKMTDDGLNIRVFYAMKEENGQGDSQYRLYGLDIEPIQKAERRGGNDFELDVTRCAYDLVLPTNRFEVVELEGTPCLYWLATAPAGGAEAPTVWQAWTVTYDAAANAFAAPAVFAQFEVPKLSYEPRDRWGSAQRFSLDAVMEHVILTGTGTAYFDVVASDVTQVWVESLRPDMPPRALYRFPERLRSAADLVMAVPEASAVAAGDFADIALGVRNAGNLGIAAFGVTLYEVSAEDELIPIETVYVNAVDPERSRVVMAATGNKVLSGREVARRAEDYDLGARRQDWVLNRRRTAYRLTTNYGEEERFEAPETLESETRYLKTGLLMPGSTAAFRTAFRIPDSWEGKRRLRLALTSVSVTANPAGILANAPGEGAQITYALDEASGLLTLRPGDAANSPAARAAASGLYADAIEASDIDVDVSVHDLSVSARQYTGWNGEAWLDLVLHNFAATRDEMKLSCAVYLDGAQDPVYLSLPYSARAVTANHTQTISMPVSALVGDPMAHRKARVVVTAVGAEERAYANNEIYLWLGGDSALSIVRQPTDVTIQAGEDASFSVQAEGGAAPYAYQWQLWDEVHRRWVDLEGFTEAAITRRGVERRWDGARLRCVVTDAGGTRVVSEAATLTVRERVPTGDDTRLPLYLAAALAALLLLALIRRRAKQ